MRVVAATAFNAVSSRSHTVFSMKVERLPKNGAPAKGAGGRGGPGQWMVKVNLVDLAGREQEGAVTEVCCQKRTRFCGLYLRIRRW